MSSCSISAENIDDDAAAGESPTHEGSSTQNKFRTLDSHEKFDVIIGSDLVYCESDSVGVTKVVKTHMATGGIFLFVVPQPRHRYNSTSLGVSSPQLGVLC
jgi:predicted nicotinamide N-methyase